MYDSQGGRYLDFLSGCSSLNYGHNHPVLKRALLDYIGNDGITHALHPGAVYALDQHDRHILRPGTDMLTACVFNPPVTGSEVHDDSGAYPADTARATGT